MTPTPIAAISSYHAHIYFKDAAERERAASLRTMIAERFAVRLGRWHEAPIGPHPLPMYQVAFNVPVFASFIPFLMLNRMELTILIHPNTSNPRRDHLKDAFWLGNIFPIMRPEQLPEADDEHLTELNLPNTSPSLAP